MLSLKYLPKSELLDLYKRIDRLLKEDVTYKCRQCRTEFEKIKRSHLCKDCKISNDRETRKKRYKKTKALVIKPDKMQEV